MTDDEIKILYLKKAELYKTGKKMKLADSIREVRLAVQKDLEDLGWNGFLAAVTTLAIKNELLRKL
jgi:hypothetical protein